MMYFIYTFDGKSVAVEAHEENGNWVAKLPEGMKADTKFDVVICSTPRALDAAPELEFLVPSPMKPHF